MSAFTEFDEDSLQFTITSSLLTQNAIGNHLIKITARSISGEEVTQLQFMFVQAAETDIVTEEGQNAVIQEQTVYNQTNN